MKPTHTIDPELLDNAADFTEPFYRRFHLRHAPQPLQLNDKIAKNYLFPTFYGDVTCAIGVFLCDWEKAARLMPHPKLKPISMLHGRSLVIFSCYEYKKVLGVAPYNEIAMTIPVLHNPAISVPVLPMLAAGLFPNFGYYCFSMPVTSLENQIRGVKIWGLPKVVHEIEISDEGDQCVVVDHEESGEPYFELRVPREGKPMKFDVSSNLYTRLGNELKQSETNFASTFNVTKHMGVLFNDSLQPDEEVLRIGDTPSGRVLRDLDIRPHPFQFRYARGMTACFDLSNDNFRSPVLFAGDGEETK